MRNRMILVPALLFAGVMIAAATPRGGMMGAMGPRGAVAAEEVELTGRLRLAADQLPMLIVDGDEYTLHIPPFLATEMEVRDGQLMTVTGLVAESVSRDLLSRTSRVMVRAVQIDGTDYVAPFPRGHMLPGRSRDPQPADRFGGRRWAE